MNLHTKYKDILDYFEQRPFGSEPPIMTLFSFLPIEDRCIVLKTLLETEPYNHWICNKLSLALLKSGNYDDSINLLSSGLQNGYIDMTTHNSIYEGIQLLHQQIGSNYGSSVEYRDTMKLLYKDEDVAAKRGIDYSMSFRKLLLRFCIKNSPKIIIQPHLENAIFHKSQFRFWEEEKQLVAEHNGVTNLTEKQPQKTGRYHFLFESDITEEIVNIGHDEVNMYRVPWELLSTESINGNHYSIFIAWGNQMNFGGSTKFEGIQIAIEVACMKRVFNFLRANNPNTFSNELMSKIIGAENFRFDK